MRHASTRTFRVHLIGLLSSMTHKHQSFLNKLCRSFPSLVTSITQKPDRDLVPAVIDGHCQHLSGVLLVQCNHVSCGFVTSALSLEAFFCSSFTWGSAHAALFSSLAPLLLRWSSAPFPHFPRDIICCLSKPHSTASPFSLALSPVAPGHSSQSHH